MKESPTHCKSCFEKHDKRIRLEWYNETTNQIDVAELYCPICKIKVKVDTKNERIRCNDNFDTDYIA